jgi:hypothetical protein
VWLLKFWFKPLSHWDNAWTKKDAFGRPFLWALQKSSYRITINDRLCQSHEYK